MFSNIFFHQDSNRESFAIANVAWLLLLSWSFSSLDFSSLDFSSLDFSSLDFSSLDNDKPSDDKPSDLVRVTEQHTGKPKAYEGGIPSYFGPPASLLSC